MSTHQEHADHAGLPAGLMPPAGSECFALFEEAPGALLLARPEPWRLVAANRAARALFLFDDAAPTEVALADLFANGETGLGRLLRAFDGGDTVTSFDTELRDRFGLGFDAKISARLVPTGQERCLLAEVRDVTEQQRAEARTRFFLAMAESSVDAIVAWSGGDAIIYANRSSHELFGYDAEELLGRPVRDLFERQEQAGDFLQEAATGHWQGELRLRRARGTVFDAYLSSWVHPDCAGGLPVTVCFLRDITERKRAEEALRASEERFKVLFECAPDGIFLMDLNGTFLDGNKAAEEITGYTREELIGRTFADSTLLPLAEVEKARQHLAGSVPGHTIGPYRYALSRKGGGTVPVEIMSFGIDVGGQHLVLGVARDVTERERVERLTRAQRDLGVALSTASNVGEGVRLCLQTALRVSGMDCGGVYLVDEQSAGLRLTCHSGLSCEFVDRVGHVPPDAPRAQLVFRGEPVYGDYQALKATNDEEGAQEALRALAVLPVRCEQGIIGCLNVASHTADEVPQSARAALEAVATQIGSAIAHLRTEEALQQSEARHRALVAAIPDVIAEIDGEQSYIWLNGPGLDFFGHDAIGRGIAEFIVNEADRTEMLRAVAPLFDGTTNVVQIESLQRRSDGAERLLSWTLRPLHDAAGAVAGALASARDVSEMRHMHAELERYSRDLEELMAERTHEVHLLSRIITSTVTAWVLTDPAGHLIRWNQAFEELVGYRLEELVKMRWTDLIPPEQHGAEQRLVEVALAGGGHRVIEQDLCRPDGVRVPVESRFDALDVGEPEPVLFRIVTDVSLRRETERRLIEARRDAEESSRLKSEFLASISHELRTPLNGILGLANTLTRLRLQGQDEQTDEFLSRIIRSSRHLQNLITEVLDISRIEAGRLSLVLEVVSPAEVFQVAEHQFLPAFQENDLTFSFEVAPDTPTVLADRTRLTQIIINLLSNAVKFTDPGGRITVSAEPTKAGAEVLFCVADTGRGIPQDKVERVFERFEQLDRSGSRLGVGLGLAICRQLVVAQGGHIGVESELGVGSRFLFTLPAQTEPITSELLIEPPREGA